jgi:aminoglycoside 6'-N-acetyltransferase
MIHLRAATLWDVPLLRKWDERPHVVESDPNSDWQWEETLGRLGPSHQPFIAEKNGVPIGFIEILDPHTDPEQYWGPMPAGFRAIDLWIGEPDELGRGAGTEMMMQALNLCFHHPNVHTVLVDPLRSNTRAHRFYERCGFQFVRDQDFDADACSIFQITRDVWESRTLN